MGRKTIGVIGFCVYLIIGMACLISCSSSDKSTELEDNETTVQITDVDLPSTIEITKGEDWELKGKGFMADDSFVFKNLEDETVSYTVKPTSIHENSVIITFPDEMATGKYRLTILHQEKGIIIGTIQINFIEEAFEIPDIQGMNIKGRVSCEGIGIPGVVVSDGYETTITDYKGIYYLSSGKKHGYVFISVPGNYKVVSKTNKPDFYQNLSTNVSEVDERNFELQKEKNNHHVIIAMADMHLANRNEDLAQFENLILPDINATANSFLLTDAQVYGLTLGDMSWDVFWYDNKFALPEYLNEMHKFQFNVYNTTGNHDNDPYKENDFLAEQKFKEYIGPTYYSFNIGKVHYIVLDDVEYLNKGGSEGTIGERNYNRTILPNVLSWIKKDLSYISDKTTPIIVSLHVPVCSEPTLKSDGTQSCKISLGNGSYLTDALKSFSNVHILTGHTHINYNVEPTESIFEHNIAGLCGTWWWTGRSNYAKNHICCDGSTGGYGVFEINDKDIKWYYKSAGFSKEYQFRSYDLNTIEITADKYCPKSSDTELATYAGTYAKRANNNEVLINVFNYDPKWKVEVTENGKSLNVTRVSAKDPLHIISYEAFRLNTNGVMSFPSCDTAHMFKVKATSASSTLEIKVTDRFGNVYTEKMERPKAFVYSMK